MASKTKAKNMQQGAQGPKPKPRPTTKRGEAKGTGAKPRDPKSISKTPAPKASPKASPKAKSAAPVTGPKKEPAKAREVEAKKRSTARIETGRQAPTLPSAGNSARAEHRIPAARPKSAVAAPIKLDAPPRSGVVRPKTHLAETPAPPTRRKK